MPVIDIQPENDSAARGRTAVGTGAFRLWWRWWRRWEHDQSRHTHGNLYLDGKWYSGFRLFGDKP